MAQTEMLQGLCPKCGEKLDVPAHLKQFSCMYCGARLTSSELAPAQQTTELDADAQDCAAFYRDHVLETITKHIGIDKEMTRSEYPSAFDRFTANCAEIFRCLDRAAAAQSITLEDAAACYLDQLENRWSTQKSRARAMETDKFVIAIFLVPMIRQLALPISEEYCKILQQQWVSRYPKSPFYLGTYEELSAGFQKKFLGLCFITTAICRHSGKPDDCAELTAFRGFRDGYLRACPDGPALISKYYDIAPGIVLHLELSPDREARYAFIRETYLEPCYADLQAGRLRQCKERYTDMVQKLEQEYLS